VRIKDYDDDDYDKVCLLCYLFCYSGGCMDTATVTVNRRGKLTTGFLLHCPTPKIERAGGRWPEASGTGVVGRERL